MAISACSRAAARRPLFRPRRRSARLHAETTADASYVVNLGGTIIATAKFNFVEPTATYQLELDANVTGIAQLVASGTAKRQFRRAA